MTPTGVPDAGGVLPGRRPLAVAAVCVLVVLAGCGGFGTDSTSTPADATATPEAGPIQEGDLPPGVDETGIVNATRLLDAHLAEGPSGSYGLRVDPVGSDANETIRLDSGDARVRLVHETSEGTKTFWTAADEGVVAVDDRSGRVTVATGVTGAVEELLSLADRAETAIVPYVRFGEFEVVGVIERADGRFLKLEAVGIDGQALAESPWRIGEEDARVADLSGTLLLTPEGAVAAADFEVAIADGSAERFRHELGAPDEDVLDEPDWTAEAPHVEASLSDDGEALVLDHREGAPIPEGTELTVVGEDEVLGTVAVPERIEPGEQLYVVVVHEDASTSVHVGVGERPSVDASVLALRRYNSITVKGEAEEIGFEAAR